MWLLFLHQTLAFQLNVIKHNSAMQVPVHVMSRDFYYSTAFHGLTRNKITKMTLRRFELLVKADLRQECGDPSDDRSLISNTKRG